jgi:hypothetical protein
MALAQSRPDLEIVLRCSNRGSRVSHQRLRCHAAACILRKGSPFSWCTLRTNAYLLPCCVAACLMACVAGEPPH